MVTVREACEADIPALRRMAEVAFPTAYALILSKAQIAYMMRMMYSEESLHRQFAVEKQRFFIAEDDGREVGYASVERQGETLFHLQKIYVLPSAQGSGVGSALFDRIVEEVRLMQPSACRLELNVNRHNKAVGFYLRKGMRQVRSGDFPIGDGYYMNDYIMSLDL